MPLLLFRQLSPSSLTAIVEKSQRQPIQSAPQYDLQLRNNQLDLILLSRQQLPTVATKPAVPPKPPKTGTHLVKSLPPIAPPKGFPTTVADEGFESDIDTISLISSENESFGADKSSVPKPGLAETDSANGGSGTESETETEKTNTLTQKNVNSIKEGFEFSRQRLAQAKAKETFDLVDCVCYTDVTYPDVLIFVIKEEAFVFKFENLERLQNFYANFTTVKAVANQKAYNSGKNVATKYNLLQRTDQNGVMHIEIKKQNLPIESTGCYDKESSSIISIDTPDGSVTKKLQDIEDPKCNNKVKDVNLRQRAESKLITDMKLLNDVKFNTVNNKVGQKKMMVRSSSIENILNIDGKESNLVKAGEVGSLRKVWNSAEDLLDSPDAPRRPDRRRKKKPAPLPPTQNPPSDSKAEDVYSGQFVRVSVVNNDPLKEFADKTRLVVKSTANEPHPKKLGQNFNLLGRNNLASLIKPNKNQHQQVLRCYPPETALTLNRPQRTPLYEKHNSWTNSVPRILKKSSRSKSETRNNQQQQQQQPMAYRYIDTTVDYSYNPANNINNNNNNNNNNAMFLTAAGLNKTRKTHSSATEPFQRKHHNIIESLQHQPRISFGYNVGGFKKKDQQQESAMGNRVFGLTPKLKDFSGKVEGGRRDGGSKWGSETDLRFLGSEKLDKNNLKSSIKSGEGKKKNDKKVTFSAYTTVQVV